MLKEITEEQVRVAELLFYLSGAFKNGIDVGFLQREHASAIFKSLLRDFGLEVSKKDLFETK